MTTVHYTTRDEALACAAQDRRVANRALEHAEIDSDPAMAQLCALEAIAAAILALEAQVAAMGVSS
jgi:hypothetical protein